MNSYSNTEQIVINLQSAYLEVLLLYNNIKRNGRFQVTYPAYSMEKYTNSTIIIPTQPLTNRTY